MNKKNRTYTYYSWTMVSLLILDILRRYWFYFFFCILLRFSNSAVIYLHSFYLITLLLFNVLKDCFFIHNTENLIIAFVMLFVACQRGVRVSGCGRTAMVMNIDESLMHNLSFETCNFILFLIFQELNYT